jgi:hypothetical protein
VRESQRAGAEQHDARATQQAARALPQAEKGGREELESRKRKAIETAVETFDALMSERGDSGKIWASTLKQAIKRRRPGFNESYYGFRAFGNLLEEAQERGLLELGRDEKSGTYVYRSNSGSASEPAAHAETGAARAEEAIQSAVQPSVQPAPDPEPVSEHEPPRRRRIGRRPGKKNAEPLPPPAPAETGTAARQEADPASPPTEPVPSSEKAAEKTAEKATGKGRKPVARRRRSPRAGTPDAHPKMQEIPGIPEEAQND